MGLSDHQLIYCTRKLLYTKVRTHKQIPFRLLKYYTVDTYKQTLSKVYLPNYENFSDVNKAHEKFIQKLMSVIDKLALFKTKLVKGSLQKIFYGEVLESIALQDKLFKTFKRSKLNLDKKIYNKARSKLNGLILQKKKKAYFEKKLKENIAQPKDLGSTLISWFIPEDFPLFNQMQLKKINI